MKTTLITFLEQLKVYLADGTWMSHKIMREYNENEKAERYEENLKFRAVILDMPEARYHQLKQDYHRRLDIEDIERHREWMKDNPRWAEEYPEQATRYLNINTSKE